jgi:hypothetical protein
MSPATAGTSVDPATQELVERMRSLVAQNARRWRLLVAVEALGLAVAAPVAYLLLCFLIDNQWHLPVWGRVLANLGFIAGGVAIFVRIVRRWRALELTEDQVALAIEGRTAGGVQNRLINAVQIARTGKSAAPELAHAVIQENYEALERLHLERAARARPALLYGLFAAAISGAALAFWLLSPAQFSNAATRILLPFADVDPIYRTTLVVEPGNIETMGDVVIRIHIHGERPGTLTISSNIQGKRYVEQIPVPGDADTVSHTFRDVQQSMTYAVRGGDFSSPLYRIDVPTPSALSLLRVTLHYPEYTGLPDKTFEKAGGDLEALQGTRAQVIFVLDQPAEEATLLLERIPRPKPPDPRTLAAYFLPLGRVVASLALAADTPEKKEPAVQRLPLRKISPTEYAGALVFEDVVGYQLETRQPGRTPRQSTTYALRIQFDQDPRLDLVGLERQTEVDLDRVLSLKIAATDDYGLEKVGLFIRRTETLSSSPLVGEGRRGGAERPDIHGGSTPHPNPPPQGGREPDEGEWQPVMVWQLGRKTTFRQDHALAIVSLKAGEGERVELALRGVDTDPLKQGRWATGQIHTLLIGGEGVVLQMQYEQIVRTEAELKAILDSQKRVLTRTNEWVGKLDGDGGLRWDEAKNIEALHGAVKGQHQEQHKVRQSTSKAARAMVAQAGDLRISVGLLADTEMVRAHLALDSVAGRETPEAKRAALADARAAQERTVRSLEEIREVYASFRASWELANMIPFTKMLADRQKKLAEQGQAASSEKPAESLAASAHRRQAKLFELCQLIQPAFKGLGERLVDSEPTLGKAFAAGAMVLASDTLLLPMTQAAEDLKAGRWAAAAPRQAAAAKELSELHARLRQAQVEAARQLLALLHEKAKSDKEAQKALEDLKAGTAESGVKDMGDKIKTTDIVRMREVAGARKRSLEEEAKEAGKMDAFDKIDVSKLELMKDSGVRQDPNILGLGKVAEKTPRLPDNAVDRERNQVKPFVQEDFMDLIGKLLDEADELQKDFQTLTLSTNQNNSDPGDIGKVGGRLNSTGAVAATGNKKPPTLNVGGVSRTGRSGARAYGSILGEEGRNMRGRDQAQEGQQRAPDQPGLIKETKTDDPYTDTSTGTGGKKVDSEHNTFSTKDTGKFNADVLKSLDKPQKKYSIVERQGEKVDPAIAALLRDTSSKQAQVIERIKMVRKELRNLYLPTDHLDEALAVLNANLERLKDVPEADMFRVQAQTLDRLRGSLKVFRNASASFQPSVPREQTIRGRVLDEPSRPTLPTYEEAVKRYYEKLAAQ